LAFDIGTGTGVLAAILANRGVTKIVATDNSHRALDCALQNVTNLGLKPNVTLVEADLYPKDEYGQADLIVCNPPWLPAHPSSALESAIYDEKSKMLKGYLNGLSAHLSEQGEGWLILSDFAEQLGLRSRDELLGWISDAGLKVLEKIDTKARHNKVLDASDPLHEARKAELTSLWRLAKA
jgi:methylase of polypeptide subunit release factors